MRLSFMSTKGRITIPAELRKKFRLKPGTIISWSMKDGRLLLIPLQSNPGQKPRVRPARQRTASN